MLYLLGGEASVAEHANLVGDVRPVLGRTWAGVWAGGCWLTGRLAAARYVAWRGGRQPVAPASALTEILEVLHQRSAHVVDAVGHLLDLREPGSCGRGTGKGGSGAFHFVFGAGKRKGC